jgi:hypothetical protein
MKRAASICGLFATLGLMAAPSPAGMARVRSCHGGFVDLPIRQDGKPGHDKKCPSGCHASLCASRKRRGATC